MNQLSIVNRVGITSLVAAAACLGIACNSEAKEVAKTARSNVPTRMYTYFKWDRDCKSTQGHVKLLTKPQNGSLSTREVVEKINRSRSNPDRIPKCQGTPITGFRVDYISNSGFRGIDKFQIEVNYSDRKPEIDYFTVTVESR